MLKQYDDSGGLDVLDDESSSGALNNIICVSFLSLIHISEPTRPY